MLKKRFIKFLIWIRFGLLIRRWKKLTDTLAAFKAKILMYLKVTFIGNKYNLTAVVFSVVSIGLGYGFFNLAKTDLNFTYYLISVTAIYSTIQLTFLMQKSGSLRAQKESLLVSSVPLWNALTNYRYLCFLMEGQLSQAHHLEYNKALKLDITINELFCLDMGRVELIDKEHLKQLTKDQKDKKWPDYVLLVKIVNTIVSGTGSIFNLNTLNRIYAHNNKSVNTYLGMLMNEGIFDLYNRVCNVPDDTKKNGKTFVQQISDKKQFMQLQKMVGTIANNDISSTLIHLDRYMVNEVLLPLHDNTFVIEKKLPSTFLYLLFNAVCILTLGSIIPLINAFSLQSSEITRICGGVSIGLLFMSVIMLCLTFLNENDADIFKYSQIVYQGKNDKI